MSAYAWEREQGPEGWELSGTVQQKLVISDMDIQKCFCYSKQLVTDTLCDRERVGSLVFAEFLLFLCRIAAVIQIETSEAPSKKKISKKTSSEEIKMLSPLDYGKEEQGLEAKCTVLFDILGQALL